MLLWVSRVFGALQRIIAATFYASLSNTGGSFLPAFLMGASVILKPSYFCFRDCSGFARHPPCYSSLCKTSTSTSTKQQWRRVPPTFTHSRRDSVLKQQQQPRLPRKMSNRSRIVLNQILCLSEEQDPSSLLMKWSHSMKPTRRDWLSLLKRLAAVRHPLYFKVTEVAIDDESFEACIRDFTKLIDAYAREDRMEDAERILKTMDDRGFLPDAVTFTVLIQMYGKAGHHEKAKKLFDIMRLAGFKLDQKAYGSMIMAYVRAGLPEDGSMLIKEMEHNGIYAAIEVYKALLKCFARQGNAEGAQRMFDSIQFACIPPNVHTCSLLLEAYARSGDSDKVQSVLNNMVEADLHPDDQCMSIMVSSYREKDLLRKALNMLLKLEKNGLKPGPQTLHVLADWLSKLGLIHEAEWAFNEIH